MPYRVPNEADRERRRQQANEARAAFRRSAARRRAEDPIKLGQATLTVQAGLEAGVITPADVLPDDDQ